MIPRPSRAAPFRLCAALALAALATWSAVDARPSRPSAPDDEAPDDDAARRIRFSVQNLRSSSEAVRKRAADELVALGIEALPALEEAAGGDRPELAERAAAVRERILACFVRVVDASGLPIAGAVVEMDSHGDTAVLTADGKGYFPVPPFAVETARDTVRVRLGERGRADGEWRRTGDRREVRVPVPGPGTLEEERSVRGVVVGADGEGVAGARIECSNVRTPGEGLISGFGSVAVYTGDDGGFALCVRPPADHPEYGDRVPPGSRYALRIEPPEGSPLIGISDEYPNAGPQRIELAQPTRRLALEFESPDGGLLPDGAVAERVSIWAERDPDSRRARYIIPRRILAAGGGPLPDGNYRARLGEVEYEPVQVTSETRDVVRFRLTPSARFRGVVIDGVTREPVAGAIVFGYSAIARGNLARITPEEWRELRKLDRAPSVDHPAVAPVRAQLGVDMIGRTDESGSFDLVPPRGAKVYNVLAVTENTIPFRRRVLDAKPDSEGIVRLADFTLFPAARVRVRPVFEGGRISVAPRWKIPESERALPWQEEVRKLQDPWEENGVYCAHWMELNVEQEVHVPAGVEVELSIDCSSYSDEWYAVSPPLRLRLERGAVREGGDVTFAPSLRVPVRVVGPDGAAVEGVPLRKMVDGSRAWSVAHNTDAAGVATFHVPPRTRVAFRVSDLKRDPAREDARRIAYTTEETTPEEPVGTMQLTAEEVAELFGKPEE